MKNLILSLILICNFQIISFANKDSTKFELDRVYLNLGGLLPNQIQSGFYIHFNHHFMIAGNLLKSKHLVASHTYAFFYPSSKLYDEFSSKNLLFGLSTHSKKKVNLDFLIGFSEMKGGINHNIYLYQNSIMNSDQYYKSTVKYFSEYGFATRLDINFDLLPYFGINLSGQNVYTSTHSELNFSIGVNFGLVQTKEIRKKKPSQKIVKIPVL